MGRYGAVEGERRVARGCRVSIIRSVSGKEGGLG